MISKNQQTGMHGVYLVAAELTKLGYITTLTSRNLFGADILLTDSGCKKAWSIQVKTNTSTFSFWLLNKKSRKLKSKTHIYVFVNLKEPVEYFIVPSKVVADKMGTQKKWYYFEYKYAKKYQEKWTVFK